MATIATGGFARPSIVANPGLVDPRLLAADYSGLTQGIGQGMQLASNFNNQRQLALDRADANSLRELRLAAQRGQLELEPQLQRNNLALSNRRALEARLTPIELESTQGIALQNRYGAPTTGFTPASTQEEIEAGILGTYESKANKLPGQDVVVQEERVVIDPQTGEQRIVRSTKQALQTAEQIANVNADNAARAAAIDAQRSAAADELARKERAAAEAAGFREREVSVREAQERRLAGTAPAGQSLEKRRAALAATVLPSGLKLSDYLLSTRNADGSIRKDSKWYLPASMEESVPTDPQAEALAQQYFQLTSQMTDMAAPSNATTLPATPPAPAIAPGTVVRQGGKSYRFDGTNYVEIQ